MDKNIRLSTGNITGNSHGAEWKPLSARSTISNAVYEAVCPGLIAAGGKTQEPASNVTNATDPQTGKLGVVTGMINSTEAQGNNFLYLTLNDEVSGQAIIVTASGGKTKVFSGGAPVDWGVLTTGSEVTATGEQFTRDGENRIWADRIDVVSERAPGDSSGQAVAIGGSACFREPDAAVAAYAAGGAEMLTKEIVENYTLFSGAYKDNETPAGMIAGILNDSHRFYEKYGSFNLSQQQYMAIASELLSIMETETSQSEVYRDALGISDGADGHMRVAKGTSFNVIVSYGMIDEAARRVLGLTQVLPQTIERQAQADGVTREVGEQVAISQNTEALQADRIKGKDGSELLGKIKGGTVRFESPFGEIEVNLDDLRSYAGGKLYLADGTVLEGVFDDEEIEIETSVGKLKVDASEVVGIARGGARGLQPGAAGELSRERH